MVAIKKVLVLWADRNSANLGVRVLAEGSATLIRDVLGSNVELTFQDFRGSETGVSLQRKALLQELGTRKGPIHSLLSSHDLVWDTGAGDSFTDIYGVGRLLRMVWVQQITRSLGVPIVMGPQTIGPFRRRHSRWLATQSLRRMDQILTRDPHSKGLVEVMAPRAEVRQSTDVVFGLPQATQPKRHDVLLNVSGLLWGGSSHVDRDYYQAQVRDLVSALAAEGRTVSLLAHVLDNPYPDNDVPAVRKLAEELNLEFVVPEDLWDARDEIAAAEVLIGSRMHSCLNALSVGVPAISWAYSHKFEPLLRAIGWDAVVDMQSSPRDAIARTISFIAGSTSADATRVAKDARELLQATRSQLREVIG